MTVFLYRCVPTISVQRVQVMCVSVLITRDLFIVRIYNACSVVSSNYAIGVPKVISKYKSDDMSTLQQLHG